MLGLGLSLTEVAGRRRGGGGEPGYPHYDRNPYVPEEYDVLAYETNFLDEEITPYGVNASGGRTWVSNGVPSVDGTGYVETYNEPIIPGDPATFPTTNPWPVVDGRRQLRAELLDEEISQAGPFYDDGMATTRRTQAIMSSAGLLAFKYGFMEVRFRGPPGRVGGGSTDIWLGSNGWPPEIDFGEDFTTNFSGDPIAFSLFCGQHFRQSEAGGADPEAQSGAIINLNSGVLPKLIYDPITEWRVVACEITPEKVAFYVNGVKLREDDNAAAGVLWHIMLRCATGKFKPAVDADYPYVAELDYLRFYSKSEDGDQVWHWTPLEAATDYAWEPARSCNLTEFTLDDKKASFGGPWGQSSWDDEAPEVFVSKGTCGPGEKMYAKVEVTFTNQFAFGVATGATAFASSLFYPKVGADYEAFGLDETGHILHGAAYVPQDAATFSSIAAGTRIIEIAVDRTLDLAWWRVAGGNWNNNGSADPATGAGGVDISALEGLLCLAGSLLDPGDSMELKTDGTPPTGFTLWGTPA